jgi:hypothetical protein
VGQTKPVPAALDAPLPELLVIDFVLVILDISLLKWWGNSE